jgi:GTPase SAR1 family protein
VVTYEEGESLAREFKMAFFETSAMTDINVEEAFMTIAKQVKDRLDEPEVPDPVSPNKNGKGKKGNNNTTKLNNKNLKKKKGGCC